VFYQEKYNLINRGIGHSGRVSRTVSTLSTVSTLVCRPRTAEQQTANGQRPTAHGHTHTTTNEFGTTRGQFIMSTEAIDATTNEPGRFTSLWCRIESCDRPVDGNVGGRYCWTHRRTLKFSATLNDAVSEFLGTAGGSMRPSPFNGNDVREAGEFFALGLSKLFGAAFGTTVAVDPHPITVKTMGRRDGRLHWHVSFLWQENEGELSSCAAMDETDEVDDEYNDDEDGDDDD